MRHATIALFWGFSFYAFVARSLLQKLRTRDSGIRGVARDRGLAGRLAGMLLLPSWFVVGAASMADGRASAGAIDAAGLSCAVAGAVLAAATQRAMGASWRIGVRTGERTRLVRHGPFRWVRNPFFTGMSLVAIGTTLASPTVAGAIAVAVLLAALVVQVRVVEERHLLATFGDEYREYAREAGRFVPRVGRLP